MVCQSPAEAGYACAIMKAALCVYFDSAVGLEVYCFCPVVGENLDEDEMFRTECLGCVDRSLEEETVKLNTGLRHHK